MITAYDIHDTLRIPEQTVNMIKIDGPKRQVYIKLADKAFVPYFAILPDKRNTSTTLGNFDLSIAVATKQTDW
jgi:hypothetical protein